MVDDLSHTRDAGEDRGHEATDRVDLGLVVEAGLERFLEPVQADTAGHEHGPIGFDDDRLGFDVVLVLDLTDELFDDVLDRDQARRASVLVDHHRQ